MQNPSKLRTEATPHYLYSFTGTVGTEATPLIPVLAKRPHLQYLSTVDRGHPFFSLTDCTQATPTSPRLKTQKDMPL